MNTDWSTLSMPDLADHAGQWEDQLTDTQPEDYRWVFVDRLPVAAAGTRDDWKTFWQQENFHSDIPDYWVHLLEPVADGTIDPLIGTLQVGDQGHVFLNVWDGSHRLGAAATVGCDCVPMVLGIPSSMTLDQVPAELRNLPAVMGLVGTDERKAQIKSLRRPRAP